VPPALAVAVPVARALGDRLKSGALSERTLRALERDNAGDFPDARS
jgi:hypothetical protein